MTKGSNILHKTVCRLLPVAAVLSLAAGSCSVDGTSGVADDDRPVIVTANAVESALTRVDYVDSGPITSGKYYLNYPANTSGVTDVAEVEFDETGYGRAMVMPGGGALTWKQIGDGNSNRTLCLTNVSPEKHNKYNPANPYQNPIVFKEDETQFVAGRYIPYGNENTNDILLGNKSQYRNETTQNHTSNYVHFELHHCMARVRVIVETHPGKDSFDPLDRLLDKAKVEITDVVLKPYSFTPYTANPVLSDAVALYPTGQTMENYCTFEKISLLDSLDDETDGWAETGSLNGTEYPDGQYFTTYDILLPPQRLRNNDARPRLVITVNDEGKRKTYSGVLPHVMEKEGNQLQFEFLAEHLLTIRTVITNNPPELIFMPVQVVEWVDKGTFSLDAQQAGIYSEEDFNKMMEYYADYNKAKLLQFGKYKNNGTWEFGIFHNLTLSGDEIKGKMIVKDDKPDYSFDFNTWFTVTVDDEPVTAPQLKSILSGVEETPDEESAADDEQQ